MQKNSDFHAAKLMEFGQKIKPGDRVGGSSPLPMPSLKLWGRRPACPVNLDSLLDPPPREADHPVRVRLRVPLCPGLTAPNPDEVARVGNQVHGSCFAGDRLASMEDSIFSLPSKEAVP